MQKKALITGAGKRLGREMAYELARLGYDVAVHYAHSKDQAMDLVADIRAMGCQSVALQANFLQESDVQSLIPRAIQALGGALHVLVNNASIFEYDNFETSDRQKWDRHFESNLRAPFVLMQGFQKQAPVAISCPDGLVKSQCLIVNMLDQRVGKLTPEFTSYTLAKAGLATLTHTAAQALAPHIRVNGIAPGTTLKAVRQTDDHFLKQRQNTILQCGVNPRDITDALRYLVEASSVTGQILFVDGGQNLAWKTPDILGL